MLAIEIKARNVGWRCRLTKEFEESHVYVRYIRTMDSSTNRHVVFEAICGITFSSLRRWVRDNAPSIIRMINIGTTGMCHEILDIDTQRYIAIELEDFNCYSIPPISVRDGIAHWRIFCLDQASKVLEKFRKNYGEKISYLRVIQLNSYKNYLNRSPQEILTERQLEVLSIAYRLGYYEYPRIISLKNLSERMNISVASLSKMLRIAEKKIIENFLRSRSYV
jgi:predicted DNA binding protein